MTTTVEPAGIAQAEDDAAVMADDGRVDGAKAELARQPACAAAAQRAQLTAFLAGRPREDGKTISRNYTRNEQVVGSIPTGGLLL